MLIDAAAERRIATEHLLAEGVPEPAAELQSDWLVEADLRGHPSHGLQRLPVIVRRIRAGLVDPARTGDHAWRTATVLAVDGGRGLGPCVGMAAIRALCDRVGETGVAVAAIRRANHLGILSPYVEHAADRGLVGLALTTSEALVHPWGGRTALVGTNPIAVAVPADPEPFVLDMATGAVSMGRILNHVHRGAPLEAGWAVDERGEPTLDPAAAAGGAISPFGGAKGYALGLAFELIVATLTATALGREVTGTLDADTECTKGDVLIVLDPARFGAVGVGKAAGAYLAELRAAPPQPGHDGVAIPGDRARARRRRALGDGIEVPESVLAALDELRRERAA